MLAMHSVFLAILLMILPTGNGYAADPVMEFDREDLIAADYLAGRRSFQGRCSACHTLNDGGLDLLGPNLWQLFERGALAAGKFTYSEIFTQERPDWTPTYLAQWLVQPSLLEASTMVLPAPVPREEVVALMSFMMLETGAADWERPAVANAPEDRSAPIEERFPSFWNHLMTNTSRYRLVSDTGELIFKAYFNRDGSVTADPPTIRGFWRIDERDMFCYALYGLPYSPAEFVECFPVAAMAIPRFGEELWQSAPAEGVTAFGGILPGRPQ